MPSLMRIGENLINEIKKDAHGYFTLGACYGDQWKQVAYSCCSAPTKKYEIDMNDAIILRSIYQNTESRPKKTLLRLCDADSCVVGLDVVSIRKVVTWLSGEGSAFAGLEHSSETLS